MAKDFIKCALILSFLYIYGVLLGAYGDLLPDWVSFILGAIVGVVVVTISGFYASTKGE